jgi:type IV secretion system protein VirB4
MLGSKGWLERRPELYLPYIGHVLPHVVLLQDGSYMMVAHLRGAPWQLDYNETRNMRRDRRSVLLQSISEPRRVLYEHLVHHQCVEPPADLSYSAGFPADLSGAYRRKVLDGKTWRNDWFVSLIARPEMIGVATLNRNRPKRVIRPSEIDETVIRGLEEAMRSIAATLADFEPTVLSYRDEPIPVSVDPSAPEGFAVRYSEIAEALHMMRTAHYEKIAEPCGPLGGAVYDSEPEFGRDAFDLCLPGLERVGAMLSVKHYPTKTRPGMLNGLLTAPYPVVMHNSFAFEDRASTEAGYVLKMQQMQNIDDLAESARDDLKKELNQVSSNLVNVGMHDFGLAVYAETAGELDVNVGQARKIITEFGGPKVVREKRGLEAAVWRQMPGATQFRSRHGRASTKNFADLSSLESFPRGVARSDWGPATLRLLIGGNAHDFGLHVNGVPHAAMSGPTRSGKTVLLGHVAVSLEPIMGPHGLRILIDKDGGNRMTVETSGGRYLPLRRGRPSGLAPHRGWEDTPGNRSALFNLYRGLILKDGLGVLEPDDEKRLARGIGRQMEMPAHLRTMWGVREFMGFKDTKGAGYRFEKWCEGGEMGWLLANDAHLVDWADNPSGFFGFDFTELLPKQESLSDDGSCSAAASVIITELRGLMDGRRIWIGCDECRFYLDVIGDWIEDMALTGGKMEAAIWLAAQNAGHYLRHSRGRSILAQCPTKISFPDEAAVDTDLRDGFGYTDAAIRMVKTGMSVKRGGDGRLGARKFLLWRGPHENGVVDYDLSDLVDELAILSARRTSLNVFERARQDTTGRSHVALYERFRELRTAPSTPPLLLAAD